MGSLGIVELLHSIIPAVTKRNSARHCTKASATSDDLSAPLHGACKRILGFQRVKYHIGSVPPPALSVHGEVNDSSGARNKQQDEGEEDGCHADDGQRVLCG